VDRSKVFQTWQITIDDPGKSKNQSHLQYMNRQDTKNTKLLIRQA